MVDSVTIEMRKIVTIRVGDVLVFSPSLEALRGPEGRFFHKYNGMRAEVLGFSEHGMSIFRRVVASGAESEEPQPYFNVFIVRFENGDEPKGGVQALHFRLPD